MAKDGTQRGGARVGAGRKPKPLTDKIKEGKSANVMMKPADLESSDIPPVKEFLTEVQRDGTSLCAAEVYEETYAWLVQRNCEKIVSRQLVEQYAMSVSRWIHCEQIISKYGYIAKHPTTGAAIASPYVSMSQSYMKQVNTIWNEIYQIVKENCSVEFQGTPQDDVME
ncbi:MAG: P27 family phage terminase small subunit [Roseburia sp.]|nr:P27 family phage terminase small subunit [Roseburia sp.]